MLSVANDQEKTRVCVFVCLRVCYLRHLEVDVDVIVRVKSNTTIYRPYIKYILYGCSSELRMCTIKEINKGWPRRRILLLPVPRVTYCVENFSYILYVPSTHPYYIIIHQLPIYNNIYLPAVLHSRWMNATTTILLMILIIMIHFGVVYVNGGGSSRRVYNTHLIWTIRDQTRVLYIRSIGTLYNDLGIKDYKTRVNSVRIPSYRIFNCENDHSDADLL